MSETIVGLSALNWRMAAVQQPKGLMKLAAEHVVGQLRRNIPRKSSGTSRTIHVAEVRETSALVVGNKVALFLDMGTGLFGPKHQRITPSAAKALRWMGGPAGSLRLSGRARKGKAGTGAHWIYARSIKGMKARPYISRSVQEAARKVGVELSAEIIKDWNGAG
jgi:hypothetical protein